MRAPDDTDPWLESFRTSIAELLPSGQPMIEDVARSLGTSVRTLQRRLAERGVTYSRVIDQARLELATRLLGDPTLKLSDLARGLGFADPGSFTRAFRRWTKSTPRDFRRGLLRKQAKSGASGRDRRRA